LECFFGAGLILYYLIDNETLIAKCGPVVWRVDIQKISIIPFKSKDFRWNMEAYLIME